jgi:UDP-N-acetylglucosamine transferase subunit ALG13
LIFVTLGTHEQPFERLLDLVCMLPTDESMIVQHGHTPARTNARGEWIRFASQDACADYARRSSVVVCHAGVGSIITALEARKLPVAVPRLRSLGEHVDDHQLEIASAFHERGLVVACLRGDSLSSAIDAARGASPRLQPDRRLVDAVQAAVSEPAKNY